MPHDPRQVLDFWFPDDGHQNAMETHGAFWDKRMHGGMDAAILSDFADITEAAATGALDHWADTPRGTLALIIALDQFSRSYYRDTPAAYSQDIAATRLALRAIEDGTADSYAPWEATFLVIANGHCEGHDHLNRLKAIAPFVERIAARMPEQLAPMREGFLAQQTRVEGIIEAFGRHPHRNAILGRPSTAAEEDYIAKGDFPHLKRPGADA